MSFEPDIPVTVFYLATEPFRGGFRWLVRQYGLPRPVEIGNETFATEADARKSGRKALIRASARLSVAKPGGPDFVVPPAWSGSRSRGGGAP